MSTVDQRLTTLRKAIIAFRSTPGREGRVVQLQEVDEVLVAGDLHGNLGNFRLIMQRADLARFPRRHLVLQEALHGVFHYPSGGDKSHQLLELIAALKAQFPRQVHFLAGNHELAQFTGRRVMKHEQDLNELFRQGVALAYGDRASEVMEVYAQIVDVAPLLLLSPNRICFSHSLPSFGHLPEWSLASLRREPSLPADLTPGGAIYALLWGRDLRPDTVSLFLSRVGADYLVTGHVPCERGFDRPSERHLILDSLGSPAACALLPTNRPLVPADLDSAVHHL